MSTPCGAHIAFVLSFFRADCVLVAGLALSGGGIRASFLHLGMLPCSLAMIAFSLPCFHCITPSVFFAIIVVTVFLVELIASVLMCFGTCSHERFVQHLLLCRCLFVFFFFCHSKFCGCVAGFSDEFSLCRSAGAAGRVRHAALDGEHQLRVRRLGGRRALLPARPRPARGTLNLILVGLLF